jgi:hypothetical protein
MCALITADIHAMRHFGLIVAHQPTVYNKLEF